jgi:two-component system OmpR family sensor kinase
MKGPMPSIRGRLMQAVLLVSLVGGAAIAAVVGFLLHRGIHDLQDAGLQEGAEVLYGVMVQNPSLIRPGQAMLPALPHDEPLVWQLVKVDGEVILRSHQAPALALQPESLQGFSDGGQDQGWRVYSMPMPGGDLRLQVGQREPLRHRAQWTMLGAAGALTLLIGGLSSRWLSRRVHRELMPLAELSDALDAHDPAHHLAHERAQAPGPEAALALPEAQRQELRPVVQAVHDLARRLSERLVHERAFTAHAAHALRTPLAGMDAQLAVALKEVPESVRPRLLQTRLAASRLRRVVSALISLFRAGGELRLQPVSLGDLLAGLSTPGLAVDWQEGPMAPVDADLMTAALSNLLDNAVRHGATRAHVSTESHPEGVLWSVDDDGPGLDETLRAHLQHALDLRTHEAPLGLGLVLVDLVARAHGGRVHLARSQHFASGLHVSWVIHVPDAMAGMSSRVS